MRIPTLISLPYQNDYIKKKKRKKCGEGIWTNLGLNGARVRDGD